MIAAVRVASPRRIRTSEEQPADIVIVSPCAIESARLLLIHAAAFFPPVWNGYDQVAIFKGTITPAQ
jgi:hypothetical protein